MRYPVDKVYVTQVWGVNPQNYARFGLKGHNGVDFRLHDGYETKIYAPHSGKVLEARYDASGYGWYLKVENDKEGSILAHLKTGSLRVKVGDYVSEGQWLAYGGNTGNSTGPHLHWGYYPKPRDKSNGYSGTIDQLPLLREHTHDPQPTPMNPHHQKLTDYADSSIGTGNLEGAVNRIIDHDRGWDSLQTDCNNAQKENKLLKSEVRILEDRAKEDEKHIDQMNEMVKENLAQITRMEAHIEELERKEEDIWELIHRIVDKLFGKRSKNHSDSPSSPSSQL